MVPICADAGSVTITPSSSLMFFAKKAGVFASLEATTIFPEPLTGLIETVPSSAFTIPGLAPPAQVSETSV